MFARLLAAFCLFNLAVALGQSGSGLVVYLRTDPATPTRPIEQMKRELTPMLAAAGYQMEWTSGRVETSSALVVVNLHGTPDTSNSLAATAISEDGVLPFITVNCGNLAHLLAPSLLTEAGARRDFLYGRALARVLAHELYHVLANTREHARDGVAKPRFTAADLLAERFDLQPASVIRMEAVSSISSNEAPSGR
jgi:hypothetical protein